MSSWINTSQAPVWTVVVPRNTTPEELDEQFAELSRLLRAQSAPVAIVIDVRMFRRGQGGNRERAKRFFRAEKALLKARIAAWSFVTDNAALRGAIGALGLVGVFPFPTKTFDTMHAAEAWLRGQVPVAARSAG